MSKTFVDTHMATVHFLKHRLGFSRSWGEKEMARGRRLANF